MMSAAVSAPMNAVKLPVLTVAEEDDSPGTPRSEGTLTLSDDSEPKDSGIDCDAADFPDELTSALLLKMVEFYLSDENVLKDPFLLKHVRRNKEGFVSVKLLSSFRKVRTLCRDWQAVAHSIRKSKVLALNTDETKVRRLSPLPDHDETVPSRSLVVHGFPGDDDKPVSVESVSEMFSKCGDIALVRILRPGGSIPGDVKRFLTKKHPDILSEICALVEFEEYSSAKKAMDGEFGVEIIPLSTKEATNPDVDPAKDSPKKKKKNRRASNADKKLENGSLLPPDGLKQMRHCRSGSLSSQSSGYLSSSPGNTNSFFENSRFPRRHSYNTSATNFNDPRSSFASLNSRYHNGSRERLQQQQQKKPDAECSGSPWRRRKELMMKTMIHHQSDSNLSSSMTSSAPLVSLPVKTLRMPRGPDGTNGFSPRQRPRLPSTAE